MALGWFAALIAFCYWPVLIHLVAQWNNDEDMGHGFFVPILAAYIAWQKRDEFLAAPSKPNWLGLALVVYAGLQLWIATLGAELFLARTAIVLSIIGAVLFLGGWMAPLPVLQQLGPIGLGPIWLLAKAWSLVFVMMWLRWTLPRLRVDQLMYVAWKVLLPISMVLVVVVGGLTLWPRTAKGFPWDRWAGWILTPLFFAYLTYMIVAARRWSARRTREMAA